MFYIYLFIYLFNKFAFKIWKAHKIFKFFWTQTIRYSWIIRASNASSIWSAIL